MLRSKLILIAAASFCSWQCGLAATNLLTLNISAPPAPWTNDFDLGSSRAPNGQELSVDSRSLRLDGQPWMPVMGEFHFARYPENEWRDELLKMKAGGVDIVATYVFWIYHEEVQGEFDWAGRRDLRRFLRLCDEVGLKVLVRCGPWCHGEVRNGGLPDWVVAHKDWKMRSTDTNFLAKVKILYGQIAGQMHGLLWKDGGPVIGIQVDNEFYGPAAYLMTLKKMARDAGIDVPFYTRTGWPETTTPVPFGELLPCFGSYADGFWERQIVPMPGDNWKRFLFSSLRTDTAIGADLLGHHEARDEADVPHYPYLTCEIGGGMMTSYHRRVEIFPEDVASLALIHLGSGSSLPGYYMYHGGVNPDGKLTTLQESQATGYPNDLPVKSYDFQAPLGEYGQINPQYHLLRRIHLFLHDFGAQLAVMPPTFPANAITNRTDTNTLRWVVRSDGVGGLVFVNNYERLQPMPPHEQVQFNLNLSGGEKIFPSQPVTVPSDASFFWPFNFDIGPGVRLAYATAQPLCAIDDEGVRTVFFAQTGKIPAEFAFDTNLDITVDSGNVSQQEGLTLIRDLKTGRAPAFEVAATSGNKLRIVLLDEEDSLALWKGDWQGSKRVFLTQAGLIMDEDTLRLSAESPAQLQVGIFPPPKSLKMGGTALAGKPDGVFTRFTPVLSQLKNRFDSIAAPEIELVRPAGPPRDIPMSKGKTPVAVVPTESDFTNAAVWRIKLPANLDWRQNPLLRFHYAGDVARVTLGGKLIDDNFYNGKPFDLGLDRFIPEIFQKELLISVLPLRQDAPIYLLKKSWPDFGQSNAIAELRNVELVPRYEVRLTDDDQTFIRGRTPRVHDPSTIVKDAAEYWLFSTGFGILTRHSDDLISWAPGPSVFSENPKWVDTFLPGYFGGFWAPDIIRVKDHWWLYYAVSVWGKRTSAIALASNPVLDPADPKYHWQDEGIVFQTSQTNDFNAIDPAVTFDAQGRLWLVFGSYWSGIKLVELDPKTGHRITPDSPVYSLAKKKEIEASYITAHDGWYYLFVNWGICCRGEDSTYNIRMGRSREITGPYLDENGNDMLIGGGTLFLGSEGRFIGPGHAGILREGENEFVSFHFYDGAHAGRQTLGIRRLNWDDNGWPRAGKWVSPAPNQ
ncbi:MAG TPA: beta-galactosidase [Verrucomicrobiae bacterium]|nr:beta-galactosidase [Verrucomicrobiae bacterium]